jgi:glutamate carboxypeptidase
MSLENALAWLDGRGADMEALLAELVEISSHTPDRAGNDQVAAALAGAAKALCGRTLESSLHLSPSGEYGQHVSMVTPAGRKPGAVLLIGHHDTVFPKDVFSGYREDGALLRGPGVLDMKGGLVVVLFALSALEQEGLLAGTPVRVVSVSDEEVGSPEGKVLLTQAAEGAACALVFESGRTNDLIITQRKGVGAVKVHARGKAAHAGNLHHEGRNAIWALARFVDRAQQLTNYDHGATVNVGKVWGGIGKNTVPEEAHALVDFRFVAPAEGETIAEKLRQAAANTGVEGTTLTVEGGVTRTPLVRTDASQALMAEYAACARASGLGGDESPLLGGGSDANTVSALGVPAIDGLGPRGRGFHTSDEFIERASLVPKAAALLRFLYSRLPK